MTETIEAPEKAVLYGPQWYGLETTVLAELKTLQPHKPILAALLNWGWIFLIVKGFLALNNPWLYPIAIFLIAGRVGVFLQLAHEAAHGLIARGKFNDWFGEWITCFPIGLGFKEYQDPHMRHHACTNQVCDPISDSEKYKIVDIRNPKIWGLFIKDIIGYTAIRIRFLYDQPFSNKNIKDIEEYLETEEGYSTYREKKATLAQSLRKYAGIALVQSVILAGLFNLNPVHYMILWIAPMITAHMFLMRVRGIAEHGLGLQLGVTNMDQKTVGTFFTRSFGTPVNHYPIKAFNWIERILIGSLDVYYHHEHHLFPKIPYYNLHKAHNLIHPKMKEFNPYIFARGYFDCLFFPLRPNNGIPHPKPNFP